MPITAKWDNEQKTIIRIDYLDGFTWDEFDTVAVREVVAMLDSVNYKVDIISYVGEVTAPKDTLAKLPEVVASPAFSHPNTGLLVMLEASSFIEILINVASRIGEVDKFTFTPTLDEAYKAIRERRLWRVG